MPKSLRRAACTGVSFAALALAAPALAADMDAASQVARVTVYPDAAEVTRLAAINLPQGATTLIFRNLPSGVDPSSLRVSGAAEGKLTIGAVELRTAAGARSASEVARRIKALNEERDGVAAQLEGLDGKKAMMQRFAQSNPSELGSKDRPLDMSQWSAAWDAVGVGIAKVNDEMRPLRARTEEIDRELGQLERAPNPHGPAMRDALVSLEAASALKGEISLSYRAAGARWEPVYEARLDTSGSIAKPAIELVSRAQITQRTGEDWTNAEIAVATSRAARGATAPDLQPLRLTFWEPQLLRAAPPAPAAMMMEKEQAERAKTARAAAPPPVAATERQAALETGAFQSVFRLPGRVSVPGDGSTKTLRIASRAMNADLILTATPVVSETAFLEAKLSNDGDAPLLPGTVNVFRDGNLAGTARLRLVAPGEEFKLGFGADDSLRVTRAPIRRKENEPTFFSGTKVETREFRTSVKNQHAFPVKIAIVDQVPISENSAITIETLPRTTPPAEKQVGDKRGVMSWTLDLAPSEQKDVTLAYRMKWPADRAVSFEPAPVSPNAR